MSEEITGNVLSEKEEVANPNVTEETPKTPVIKEGDESGTPKTAPETTEVKTESESKGAEKRIRQLVAERHARDRKIAELEEQLKGKATSAEPVKKAGMPQAKDFEDYEDYRDARALWLIEEKQQKDADERSKKQTIDSIKKLEDGFKERIDEDSVANPEIIAVRDRVGMRISPAVAFAVKQSENAPDLIRYLDANPSEIDRLSKMDLVAAAREIGKIEVKLTSKGATKVKSGAPEPPDRAEKGGGANPTTEKSDDELPIEDYMKKFRAKGRK